MKKLEPIKYTNETIDKINLFKRYSNNAELKEDNKNIIINNALKVIQIQDKNTFYPLIEELFNIIGFKCRLTRIGDTNNRADAYIIHEETSIPIEIKSPSEVQYINNKSIRQAIENKIILLSRKFYATEISVTSLAIGFDYPAERSGVIDLIDDTYKTFKINIGIISIKDLLDIFWDITVSKKEFDKKKIIYLRGTLK